VIRFGIVLSVVLVAIGLLVAGVLAGSLLLVVASIGVAALAFLLLLVVVVISRHEIFGQLAREVPGPGGARVIAPGALSAALAESVTAAPGVASAGPAVAAGARGPDGDDSQEGKGRRNGAGPRDRLVTTESGGGRQVAGVRAGGKARTGGPAGHTGPDATAASAADRGASGQPGDLAASVPAAAPISDQRRDELAPAVQLIDAAAAKAKAGAEEVIQEAAAERSDPAASEQPRRDRPGSRGGARTREQPKAYQASRLERESARAAGASPAAGSAVGASKQRSPSARQGVVKPASSAAVGVTAKAPAPATTETAPDEAVIAPSGTGPSAGHEGSATSAGPAQGKGPPGPGPSRAGSARAAEQPSAGETMQVTVVPGITRYHRSDCLLIRFLTADDLEVMTKQAAIDGGCVPCKACKPDEETVGRRSG